MENFRDQDEVKGNHIVYCNGLYLKNLRLEGLHVEKQRRILSLLEVDVSAATS